MGPVTVERMPRSHLTRRAALLAALGILAGCGAARSRGAATLPESSVPTATPDATPEPAPAAWVDPLPAGLVNVLLIGSDTRDESNFTARSDAIALVQLTPGRDHVNIVSLARDSAVTSTTGRSTVINHLYRGDPSLLAANISPVFDGLPITYTLETTFGRFTRIVDLLGGINVQNRLASNSFGGPFAAGPIALHGPQALDYVRERKGLPLGDLDRTERHRATLTGILGKLHELFRADRAAVAALVPPLFEQVRATGLTLEQARNLVPMLEKLSAASITSVMLPVARFGKVNGGWADVLDDGARTDLSNALKAGDLAPYVAAHDPLGHPQT